MLPRHSGRKQVAIDSKTSRARIDTFFHERFFLHDNVKNAIINKPSTTALISQNR